jgi:hypothetical protein
MDKFEQIITGAQFPTAIIGNRTLSEFELVDMDGKLPLEQLKQLADRGFWYVGAIGLIQGTPRIALNGPLDPQTMTALAHAFTRRVADTLNGLLQPKGDSVEWLGRLYQLPDTRTDS